MLKSKPILPTCQCLVSTGWRDVVIKRATLEENPYRKNASILSVDVLVEDDNGIQGMINSIYYDSTNIREIVTDVSEITGKSADKITVDDFHDIYCYAYVTQRKSKKDRMYNYIELFITEDAYKDYLANNVDASSTGTTGTLPGNSAIVENLCENKQDADYGVDVANGSTKSPKDSVDKKDNGFDPFDDEEDEEYDFFDEED